MTLLTRRNQNKKHILEQVEAGGFSAMRKDQEVAAKSKPGPGRKGLPGYKKNLGLRLDGVTFEIIRRTQQEYFFHNDSDVVRALIRLGRMWLDEHPDHNPNIPIK